MRTRKIIITLTATTLFLSLSALPMLGHRVGTGYAAQPPQETTVETAATYTTEVEILVESGVFVATEVAKVGSSAGESSAEFTCWAQQRVIEGSVSYYLSKHPELTTRDLMGEVNPNHTLVANQVIAEAYKCPHTNTYYRITSDGTVKACSSHGYLIGNYGD